MPRHAILRLVSALVVSCLAFPAAYAADPIAPPAPAEHPPGLSPAEALQKFKIAAGLEISLVVAEPEISQPLSISFDDRGRMWVLQYRQYPNPNGLKAVEMDNWLRTKYDKVPDPPPRGPKGEDRISICEDTDGDGRADSVKHFISDLNLASGMALGHGGVFVVQPPYLLFYADRDRDDRPDGPPQVLLKGFGMQDAHAFANSLTWGPDGWLYGAQGSTVTANIRGIEFQQGVWRYHPLSERFELFAEGGGNSFGLDFDQFGNVFAAGNEVEPLVHHVQGAYYVKGFGKHGPLHNPHAYGYFQPTLHHGYLGDSLSGGAVLYQGGAFPSQFNHACIAPHTRHSACRYSTLETRGSTFATRHAGDFVTSEDIWFRPVDMTVGPDGAVYIADWYDYNISHSSPKNRSQWYQPSRLDGRVWRVAPPAVKPIKSRSFDLSQKSSEELVALEGHANDWYVRAARRILAERRDASVRSTLEQTALADTEQIAALRALWAAYVSAGLADTFAAGALDSPHEYVRAWAVRLLGDTGQVAPPLAQKLAGLGRNESSVVVRSQLACTAKRLPATESLAIIAALLTRDEDADDVQMPLLLWWAIEDKAISTTPGVLALVEASDAWRRPLVERTIVERLARRFAAEGSEPAFAACARLLELAPTDGDSARVQRGMLQALAGRKLDRAPAPLEEPMRALLGKHSSSPTAIELALRMNLAEAAGLACQLAADNGASAADRAALIQALGETRTPAAVDPLLTLVARPQPEALHVAALAALGYFSDERVGAAVLAAYPKLAAGAQARAIDLLCSRQAWAARLVEAVDAGSLKPTVVSLDQLRQLPNTKDERLNGLIAKHWGRIQAATSLEKQGRIAALSQMLPRAPGDLGRGREQFEKICANCHKLHGAGNTIGPDLAAAERKNRDLLLRNVVDPSAIVRQEFLAYMAVTDDGRVLNGLLAESTAETITILDAKNKRTVLARGEVERLEESTTSLMPEKLLDDLTDQQIRDLFAYLQSDGNQP